jgi:uncharacterized membrane protein YdjX (TVP38/TMEM64 family)
MENNNPISNKKFKIITAICTVIFLAVLVFLTIRWWQMGLFTSLDTLQQYIESAGVYGSGIFILVQLSQIIIPFIPGGVTCLAGVLLFGPWKGFWLNYISILIGGILAFLLGRIYGKPILYKLFDKAAVDKYETWAKTKNRFAKLFSVCILLPGFPDDMLCWLAGTTDMPLWVFTLILVIGKPPSLAIYSLGLDKLDFLKWFKKIP